MQQNSNRHIEINFLENQIQNATDHILKRLTRMVNISPVF